jgi:hypothetical protein
VWDVVDGLQRLATIFQFVGILKNEKGDLEKPLILEKTDDLPSLKGMVWDADIISRNQSQLVTQTPLIEDDNSSPKAFTQAQRLLVKRAKIQVSIILKESDEKSKYDLFQRLNTGGSSLSSQELRNCILISINHSMYTWLRLLANDENFISCINLTDRVISEQYDLELVLRFLVFRDLDSAALKNIGDLDDFLTKRMRILATSSEFDENKETRYFKETFEILAKMTKGDSFRRYDATKGRFVGGFLVSAFEVVALGVGYNLDHISNQPMDIEKTIKQMWQMQEFIESAGSGKSASSRISRVIPLGRRLFGL